MKKLNQFFDGAIGNFILFLLIISGITYGIYITVKFVLVSNNLI